MTRDHIALAVAISFPEMVQFSNRSLVPSETAYEPSWSEAKRSGPGLTIQ